MDHPCVATTVAGVDRGRGISGVRVKALDRLRNALRGTAFFFLAAFAGQVAADFTATGSMATARAVHTATRLADGKVLIAGGGYICGYGCVSYLASAELYNPLNRTFTATGSMAIARYYATATALADGKVLIAGGYGSAGYLASAEVYDPATGTFAATGGMGVARYWHTATLLADGKVLIAGGYGTGGQLASAEVYDPATGAFTAATSMGVPRYMHTATLLADGKVLFAGGYGATGYLASWEVYDPASGRFTSAGNMATARGRHAAALLADGKVLVAGGIGCGSFSCSPLASAELYDPSRGTFSATGGLATARTGPSATLLVGGRVLIAGGYVSGWFGATSIQSAEQYDPASGRFTTAGSMTIPRREHTATLLPDGKVLIAAGIGSSTTSVASAELYSYAIPPVANAGPDQAIYLGQSATLSGTGSSDPGGAPLTYAWALDAKPGGSNATLSSSTGVTTSLTPDVIGQYTISLVVNNGTQSSDPDTVLVAVAPPPDTVAPTTTASASPPPNSAGWNAGNVTISLAAADNEGGSGVRSISYTITNGGMVSGANPTGASTSFSVTAEGINTVSYYAIDNAGNAETAKALVLRIDKTAPVLALPGTVTADATGPAGASVGYSISATDNSGLAPDFACTPASGSTFPIGTSTVGCTATDAAGNSASGSFTVTVNGPAAQAENLTTLVESLNLGGGTSTSLTSKLDNAIDLFATGSTTTACNVVNAFVNQVKAQSGKKLTSDQADQIIADAERIRAAQGCP